MKRTLLAMAAVGVFVGAALLPAPAAPEAPDVAVVVTPVAERTAVLYCPGTPLDLDPVAAAASLAPASVRFTLADGGSFTDAAVVQLPEPGEAVVDIGEQLRFYDGAIVVELTGGPAGAEVIATGPAGSAGFGCQGSISKEWHFAGGAVRQGDRLILRLFNPLLDAAKATVTVTTEFGVDPIGNLEAVPVPARDSVDLALEEIVGLRNQISLTITNDEGVVVPLLVATTGEDSAVWAATGLGTEWFFPVVDPGGPPPRIAVFNPGTADAAVSVDVVSPQGTIEGAIIERVPGNAELRLPLGEIDVVPFGLRLESDNPVAAAVVARGGARYAAVEALGAPAQRWLVPAAAAHPSDLTLAVMNTGAEAARVEIAEVAGGLITDVEVAAGSLTRVTIPGTRALVVDSSAPVSVGWALTASGDIAFGTAVSAP